LGRDYPGLTLELMPSGDVLDLARREADIAVRGFRSKHESLVVRRVADVAYGLYASAEYLGGRTLKKPSELRGHAILTSAPSPQAVDAIWFERLTGGARPSFVSELAMALHEAARAGAGIAVLPRYLGDADPALRHLPMPDEPTQPVWITVHRDVRDAPRVRVVLDYLAERMKSDRALFLGR
jgi:DNA-binding transcriptional LysR family regulator